MVLLGHGLRRFMGFREDFWPQLDKLVYFVFFPALLFGSLSGFTLNLGEAAPMLQVGVAFTLIGMGLGALASLLFRDPPRVFAIAVGAGLRLRGLRESRGHLWYGVTVKLGVLPAVAWGMADLAGLQGIYFHTAVLMAALPVSTVAYVLATRMGGDGNIIAAQVALTTLFSMVTRPLWLMAMGF